MEAKNDRELKTAQGKSLGQRVDTAGWGLFFIWVGVAALADLGWGVGLIGVGLIVLGAFAAREGLARAAASGKTTGKG